MHLGAWGAEGELQVWVEGAPALAPIRRVLAGSGSGRDAIVLVDFADLRSGQALIVDWTIRSVSRQYGNLTLQAAALAPAGGGPLQPAGS